MLDLNLFDETFDKNQSHNYHLSIQTAYNGITMCLLDTVRNKFIGLRHHPISDFSDWNNVAPFQAFIESDDIFKHTYKSVSTLIVDAKNTIVPIPYYDESKNADLLQLNHKIASLPILSNKLDISYTYNVFPYPEKLKNSLTAVFPELKIYHRSSPFLEHMVHESAKWARSKCFVLINKNSIDIGLAQLKKLQFCNSFEYKENSDIVYFILSILEQFKLSVMYTDVYLSVNTEDHHEIFDFLNYYLNMIRFIRPSDQFTYSYIFDEVQLTRFANLFNLSLCE